MSELAGCVSSAYIWTHDCPNNIFDSLWEARFNLVVLPTKLVTGHSLFPGAPIHCDDSVVILSVCLLVLIAYIMERGYYEVWAKAVDDQERAQPMLVPGWNPKGYLNNTTHGIAVVAT